MLDERSNIRDMAEATDLVLYLKKDTIGPTIYASEIRRFLEKISAFSGSPRDFKVRLLDSNLAVDFDQFV